MPNDTVELVKWNCECGGEGCSATVTLPPEVIKRLFDTRGLFVVSISCQAEFEEGDEFVEQGDGYSLYRYRETESE